MPTNIEDFPEFSARVSVRRFCNACPECQSITKRVDTSIIVIKNKKPYFLGHTEKIECPSCHKTIDGGILSFSSTKAAEKKCCELRSLYLQGKLADNGLYLIPMYSIGSVGL